MDRTHSHSPRPLHPNTALYRVPIQHPTRPASVHSAATPLRRPSMAATGFDPAATDFRTFYPYVPNEVKHRKRTTRSQQVVLEEVFQTNTKPNAALRKELALQLDMQARGVQVWFQNRRAKEKKRLDSLNAHRSTSKLGRPCSPTEATSPEDASPRSSTEADLQPESPSVGSQRVSIDINVQSYPISSSQESSPADDAPPQLGPDQHYTSWPNSPTSPHQDAGVPAPSGGLTVPDAHLLSLRRGSLPINAFAQTSHHSTTLGPPAIDDIDPLTRRRSVDTSLHRLAQHPYARLAMEKNGLIGQYGPPGRHVSSYHQQISRMAPSARPGLLHRGSLPGPSLNMHSLDTHSLRYPNSGLCVSPSPSPLSPSYAVRATLSDCRAFAAPSRPVPVTLPGPLPSPTFSFGAPADSPPAFSPNTGEDEHGTPDPTPELLSFAFPVHTEGHDEDESSTTSYSAISRGSIISIGSESSNTSAYYSEVSSPVNFDSRRGSCASGGFLDLMSGLDMNCQPRHGGLVDAHARRYSSQENLGPNSGSCVDDGTTSYPSPTSTISAGPPENSPTFTISKSSELAFALTGKQEENSPENKAGRAQYTESPDAPPAEPEVVTPAQHPHQYFYGTDNAIYSQSGPNSSSCSSLSLPMMEFASQFENMVPVSSTGHYHTVSYADNPYPSDAQFSSGTQDHHHHQQQLHHHHQTDYTHCSVPADAYSTYHTLDSSTVGPAPHENFVAYA